MMFRAGLIFPLSMVTLVLAGCGQGEYESRMDGALAAAAKRGGGQAQGGLLMPDFFTVSDNARTSQGLKLKLPTLFSQQTETLADIPRAKFSGAAIPGFLYTMERPLTDNAGKAVPAYCYLYSVNKAATPADQLHEALQAAASGFDPNAAWADTAPVNGIPVKKLEANGPMEYELAGAVTETQPSKLQLYSFDAGANQVVIGFRAADIVAANNKFFEAVAASIATAQLDNAAAAPAPMPMPTP